MKQDTYPSIGSMRMARAEHHCLRSDRIPKGYKRVVLGEVAI